MAKLEKTMFREYDIRGRENEEELNTGVMELIGRGYGTFLQKRKKRHKTGCSGSR